MRDFLQDLRFGLRLLVRNRGFTGAAVLSLALGIGANTLIFSVVNALLLKPLPVEEPETLTTIYTSFETGSAHSPTSYFDYVDIREGVDAFSDVAAQFIIPVSVKGSERPEVVLGSAVTSNYFDVLGVEAALGRTFLDSKGASEDSEAVAVVSHTLWKSRFGSDPDVVGKTVLVNSHPFTIIGVAPIGFTHTQAFLAPDIWIPVLMAPRVLPVQFDIRDRGERWLRMVGRLKPGVDVEQAHAALMTLASNLQQEYPDSNDTAGFTVVEANRDRFLGDMEEAVSVAAGFLMMVVGLVLLIACSNVAHLLMARAVGRQREVAMKLALGSGRRRIVRQFVTESVLLSLLAGVAGLLLAAWAIELIFLVQFPTQIPITFDVALDWTVLGYTAAVSILTGMVIGLVPAFRIRDITLYTALKDQGSGVQPSTRAFGLHNSLVIGQVALCFLLIIATGLILKSVYHLLDVDPGFEYRNVLVLDLNLTHGQYDEAEGKTFYRRLVERVEQLPGVQSASLAYVTPFSMMSDTYSMSVEGYEAAEDENMTFYGNIVDPRFFETLGMPIVQGRGFTEQDREDTLLAVVINETMAERFWPGKDPVGARIRTRGEWHRVIGVARDTKYRDLAEPPQPYIYLALRQRHVSMSALHVRTAGDPILSASAVQHEAEALDPNLPVWVRPMSEQMAYTLYWPVMLATGIGCFGLLALVLALVGIYGVMSYSVRQRTREIGVRTALGAGRREIIRLVLGRGLAVTLIGLGLGLAGAFAVTRLFSSMLFQVSALDPVVFIGVSATLASAALLACLLPARWAARIDPAMALHYE